MIWWGYIEATYSKGIFIVYWICLIKTSFLLCYLYFINNKKHVIQEEWEGWTSSKDVLHPSTHYSFGAKKLLFIERNILSSRQIATCKQHYCQLNPLQIAYAVLSYCIRQAKMVDLWGGTINNIYIHICIYMHIYICIYVCIYICICATYVLVLLWTLCRQNWDKLMTCMKSLNHLISFVQITLI
jgi:hypothetical protein